jgi:CelD/BcsL family acetyltransferase involved in cellulose biosynthesis
MRATPPRINIVEHHGAEAVDGISDDWQRLSDAYGSFFQTKGWVDSWRSVLVPDADLCVLTASNPDGATRGLLALAQLGRPIHRRFAIPLRYLGLAGSGLGAADHLGPLGESDAGETLLRYAIQMKDRPTLYLESLAAPWNTMANDQLDGRLTRTITCPVARRTPAARFSDNWSKKARKNHRRRERQLAEAGVSATWVPAGPGFDAALETLRWLHNKRWIAAGGTGLFDETRLRFLKDLGTRFTPPNGPWVLLMNGPTGPVGGLLGFRHRDTMSIYKTGWDPDHRELGIGLALGAETMEWAEQMGVTTVDYLRGPRAHKDELGCLPEDDWSVVWPKGPSGHILSWRESLGADGNRLPGTGIAT